MRARRPALMRSAKLESSGKTCSHCGVLKGLHDFEPHRQCADGRVSQCRDCSRDKERVWRKANPESIKARRDRYAPKSRRKAMDRYRLRVYGITPEQFEALTVLQNGKCAICGATESSDGRGLCVDHCHATGVVRGLLCSGCNKGLGHFSDSADRMLAASEYLRSRTAPR